MPQSAPNAQVVSLDIYWCRNIPPMPDEEPEPVAAEPRAVTRDINDCAMALLCIDSMIAPYPELHSLGRQIQQCRMLLASRGAVFPENVSFEIGISSVGDAGIG